MDTGLALGSYPIASGAIGMIGQLQPCLPGLSASSKPDTRSWAVIRLCDGRFRCMPRQYLYKCQQKQSIPHLTWFGTVHRAY